MSCTWLGIRIVREWFWIARMSAWTSQQGIEPDVARQLVAQMTKAAATSALERNDTTLEGLVDELATPRSFTGLGLDVLNSEAAFASWHKAAQTVVEQHIGKSGSSS